MAESAISQFSPEEKEQLIKAFESLGTKPKMDSADDLRQWMTGFTRAIADDGDVKPKTADLNQSQSHGSSSRSTTHYVHPPTIAVFHGDAEQKGVPFDTWKFEVLTLQTEGVHSSEVIITAARKSLRGEAAQVCQRLGVNASVQEILNKFEGIYGTVEDTEDLMTLFYSARQNDKEKVSTWGCRLEDLIYRAKKKQKLSDAGISSMLVSKFFSGLRDPIKDRIRHLVGEIKDFDALRMEARKVEAELADNNSDEISTSSSSSNKQKKAQVKMLKVTDGGSDDVDWPQLVYNLQARVDQLEWKPKQKSRFQNNNQSGKQNRGNSNEPSQQSGYKPRGAYKKPTQPNTKQTWHRKVPTCFRCGQEGHLQIGCRVEITSEEESGNDPGSAVAGQQ